MPKNINLPIVPLTNLPMGYGQEQLLAKLQTYIDIKKYKLQTTLEQQILQLPLKEQPDARKNQAIVLNNCALPFNTLKGLCSGLVAYWLYLKRNGQEQLFIDQLTYALTWKPEKFRYANLMEDDRLEEFINNVAFLQHDVALRNGIKQNEMHKSIEFIRSDSHPVLLAPEFEITFVFSASALKEIIDHVALPNKMLRIDNGFHTLGVMYSNDLYFLYNPGSPLGPQPFKTSTEVTHKLIAALAEYCKSTQHIALNLTVSDFEPSINPNPLIATDYYQNALANNNLSIDILKHPNILRLGVRFEAYDMLDMLFAAGYKYVRSNIFVTSEYGDAVVTNSFTKLQYLLDHDIPLDYRTENGLTPLGDAVEVSNIPMLYKLLLAGADPNIPANDYWPLIKIAIYDHNTSAIILLLAFGLNISLQEFEATENNTYTHNEFIEMVKQAMIVNEIVLQLPAISSRKNATDQQLILWLLHEELKLKLLKDLSKSDQHEINSLLKSIATNITKKPFASHSKQDLLQINQILNILQSLLGATPNKEKKGSMLVRFGVVQADMREELSKTQTLIKGYLNKNGVDCLTTHIENLEMHNLFRRGQLLFRSETTTTPSASDYSRVSPFLVLKQ